MPMYAYDRNANPDAQANLDRDFPDGGSSDVNAELQDLIEAFGAQHGVVFREPAERETA